MYDIMAMGNGALAGLVAITSGCSTVQPWAACVIGTVAGSLYCIGSKVSILCKVLAWGAPACLPPRRCETCTTCSCAARPCMPCQCRAGCHAACEEQARVCMQRSLGGSLAPGACC